MKKTILILFLLLSGMLHAATVSDLYSVRLSVKSHATAERNHLIKQAFKIVLTKLTGNPDLDKTSALLKAEHDAVQYVQEYSYETISQNFQDLSQLKVTFNPLAIRTLLQKNQQFIWGNQRPSLLVWAVNQNSDGSMALNTAPGFKKTLVQEGSYEGLPILFPLFDMTDLQTVTPNDVAIPFLSVVQQASQRYQSDAILLIRTAYDESGKLQSRWSYVVDGITTQIFNISGKNSADMIHQGMSQLASYLAKQAQTEQSVKNQVILEVNQLQSMSDYAKTLNILRHLSYVKKVLVLDTTPNSAEFQLTILGPLSQLNNELQTQSNWRLVQ